MGRVGGLSLEGVSICPGVCVVRGKGVKSGVKRGGASGNRGLVGTRATKLGLRGEWEVKV